MFFLVKTNILSLIQAIKKLQTSISKLKTLYKFRVTIKKIIEYQISNKEPFLKPYIERNTDLRREARKERNKTKNQNAKL